MGIFYEITAPNGKKSHLFGTLHAADAAIITLHREVIEALEKASCCVVEADFLEGPRKNVEGAWILNNPLTQEYKTHAYENMVTLYTQKQPGRTLSQEDKENFENNIATSTPIASAHYMLGYSQLTFEAREPGLLVVGDFLDKRLLKNAKYKYNIPVYYLEECDDALSKLKGCQFNLDEQIEYYEFVSAYVLAGKKTISCQSIKKAYLDQNIENIEGVEKLGMGGLPLNETVPEIIKRYNDQVISERDTLMAASSYPYLEAGNAFIAVGSAHLKGIIERLQSMGYVIKPIPLSDRVHLLSDMAKEKCQYDSADAGLDSTQKGQGNPKAARAHLDEPLCTSPMTNPLSQYKEGIKKQENGQYAQAKTYFLMALDGFKKSVGEHSIESGRCHCALASLSCDLLDYSNAVIACEKAVDIFTYSRFSLNRFTIELDKLEKIYIDCLTKNNANHRETYLNAVEDCEEGRFHLAIYKLKYLLGVYKIPSELRQLISCYSTLALCYEEINQEDKATTYSELKDGLIRKIQAGHSLGLQSEPEPKLEIPSCPDDGRSFKASS